jgi:tetratricopeptide (TPR) repeat protein
MSQASVNADGSLESLVGQVADDFLRRQRDGERPDIEEYLARYPQAAQVLRTVLASLRLLDQSRSGHAATALEEGPAEVEGTLGDFRILREVGRGGMGVVYEAVQISLGRRVALKVLPFAAALDERQLQRFKNEAQAAAGLHHTNIVPVFAVGCERGIHFYAMQLINGQTLACVLADLRQQEDPGQAPADPQRTSAYVPAPAAGAASAEVDTPLAQVLSTQRSTRSPVFFRSVARLGMQAAEALEHAHQVGVVHRDVKPGNLMIDVRGNLWVTDFGLAHIQSDTRLTMTGDLVGTLRYMSPEQALAQRVVIDHRTDVYSLGATLYELLTLRPVFAGRDRQELLRQIAFDEPQTPRRINKAIPGELETIVLKALAKNPAERYATAQELADDLRRWLEDRPIKARRPSLRQVALKWARRHRPVVWAAGVVLLIAAVFSGAAGLREFQKRARAEGEARAALEEGSELQKKEKWFEALSAVRRAKGVLAGVWADRALRREVEELDRDLEMALRLQEARLRGAAARDRRFDWQAASAAYEEAFAWYGLEVESGDPRQAGEFIRSRSIWLQFAAALDDWAGWRNCGNKDCRHLLAIARVADPDKWRNRLRDALERTDPRAVEELAASAQGDELPPATVVLLARVTRGYAREEQAVTALQQAQQRHPDDFWVNFELGACLANSRPPRLEEAIRFYTAAVALRPQSPGAWLDLGYALGNRGKVDEAIVCARKAIRLQPDSSLAHFNLGNGLQNKGEVNEAMREYREAIRLDPNYAKPHNNLGRALAEQGKLDEAMAHFRQAIRLDRGHATAHANLGGALRLKQRLDEAIAECREAIRLQSDNAVGHGNLGLALHDKGQVDEAIACMRKVIRLTPNSAQAHYNLGLALRLKGEVDEAIREYHEAIRLKPDFNTAHTSLGHALVQKGRFHEAVEAFRRGHQLGSGQPGGRSRSPEWLRQAETMARLDDRLSAVLAGKDRPKDAAERLGFAQLCQLHRHRYAAAARFYQEAFTAQPALAAHLQAGHRYNAACAAALAGCGKGDQGHRLPEQERLRWRQQALTWLQADLDGWRVVLEKGPDRARPVIIAQLQHWQSDPDFAGLRGAEPLARLPETERPAWQKLWADVADTLARAQAKASPGKKPDLK